MQHYTVSGIIQTQINGHWSERPATIVVRADGRDAAMNAALAAYASGTGAVVRWHTPEWVAAARRSA